MIELLVVVSIIGLLSSVILTSIGTAREKAQDQTVRTNLGTLRPQAALYHSNNGNYGAVTTAATCPTSGATMFYADTIIRNAIAAAKIAGGGATRCATDGVNFAVSVQLKSSTDHWCLDSTGAIKQTSTTGWTGYVCP
jgi:type II secretory pathway pseudopilin PulG